MPLNLPTFYKRTASAIVFAAIMLAGLLWNDMAFLVLISLINVLCLRDYFRLMQKIDQESFWPKWLPVAVIVVSILLILFFAGMGGVTYIAEFLDYTGGAFAVLFPVLFILFFLLTAIPDKSSIAALMQSAGGLFYITLPMCLLFMMEMRDFILPIAVILMMWTNDTMAYLVGAFIGKHPFSPISPKKTWEGTIGGIVLTIAGAGFYAYFAHSSYRITDWMLLTTLATVAGTLGDLLESKLKRIADVKDSGTMMPGHGGALDRFDSLLVAVPFAYVYTTFFMR